MEYSVSVVQKRQNASRFNDKNSNFDVYEYVYRETIMKVTNKMQL